MPPEWKRLLEAISQTYAHFDEDRRLIERSLEVSSKELSKKNAQLQRELNELTQGQTHIAKLEEARRATLNILHDLKTAKEDSEKARLILNQRTEELEKFNRLMVGREIRMIELKNENLLLRQRATQVASASALATAPPATVPAAAAEPSPQAGAPEQTRVLVVNAYTAIAALYCASFAGIFYWAVHNKFLAIIHLIAFIGVSLNYWLLRLIRNFELATHVILSMGTLVVTSLFATGGWNGTGFLWPFAYLPYAFFLARNQVAYLWVGILFAGCGLAVWLDWLYLIDVPYGGTEVFNYFAALAIFCGCMVLFIVARERYERQSQLASQRLQAINLQLKQEVKERSALNRSLGERTHELGELNRTLLTQGKERARLEEELRQVRPPEQTGPAGQNGAKT